MELRINRVRINRTQPVLLFADEKECSEKESSEKRGKKKPALPEEKWRKVYRALKPFLRPYGDSKEGRIDFYHRALSKAVRRK